jgi:hypothetical protein
MNVHSSYICASISSFFPLQSRLINDALFHSGTCLAGPDMTAMQIYTESAEYRSAYFLLGLEFFPHLSSLSPHVPSHPIPAPFSYAYFLFPCAPRESGTFMFGERRGPAPDVLLLRSIFCAGRNRRLMCVRFRWRRGLQCVFLPVSSNGISPYSACRLLCFYIPWLAGGECARRAAYSFMETAVRMCLFSCPSRPIPLAHHLMRNGAVEPF